MSLNDFVLDVIKQSEESDEYKALKDALRELQAEQEDEEVYMVTFSSQ